MNGAIMIVGVGGQGTLLASKIIGHVYRSAGYDVKVSEVHGMSQRGGSVVTYVRYSKSAASPIVDLGEADVILAFEELEGARYLPYLKKGGKMIINRLRLSPMPVLTGAAAYPDGLVEEMRGAGADVYHLDAQEIAEKSGSVKAANVALLGVFAKYVEAPKSAWEDALRACVPEKFLELNLKAFELAYNS
jgi:indolepyruvate ferredoxin oxidoreductase beta subunit